MNLKKVDRSDLSAGGKASECGSLTDADSLCCCPPRANESDRGGTRCLVIQMSRASPAQMPHVRKRKRGGDDGGGRSSSDDSEVAERSEHHYMMQKGDEFDHGRYQVTKQLGKGTFGRVVEMRDSTDKVDVAVKVIRAVDKYAREAEIEAEIIRELQRTLPTDIQFPIVKLHRTFQWKGHYCLAFEKMGPSLYSALKSVKSNAEMSQQSGSERWRGGPGHYFSLGQIAHIAADCFAALTHMHEINLTHTDLKPENILFLAPLERGAALPEKPMVALIDFGGATWKHEQHSSIVCTRQYRPPEVTLGLGWGTLALARPLGLLRTVMPALGLVSTGPLALLRAPTASSFTSLTVPSLISAGTPIDCWSMGCILAELWTGSLLFSTHDEVGERGGLHCKRAVLAKPTPTPAHTAPRSSSHVGA